MKTELFRKVPCSERLPEYSGRYLIANIKACICYKWAYPFMTEQELLDLKQEINEAKDKSTKLQGRKDLLVEQLKEKYNVTTLKQAKEKLKKMEQSLETLHVQIEDATEKLEEKLNVE